MKATGIVRKIDHLNRVVIPKELCRTLKLTEGSPVEFYTEGDGFFIRKYDAVGDVDQMLDRFEKEIKQMDHLIGSGKAMALTEKIGEMRVLLREKGK